MTAPISVIIPTLNAGKHISTCFASLAPALIDGLLAEVIVCDGGSDDDTCLIADAAGAVVVNGKAGRGRQLAMGADKAKGDWLLFLHADSDLDQSFSRALKTHMQHPAKAGFFCLGFDQNSFGANTVARWANFRARVLGLPYGDQGLLIHKNLYREIGGYPEISIMEDVAIIKKLRGKLLPVDCLLTTSAEKYVRQGWIKRSVRNFRFLIRYYTGGDIDKIAADYYR